MYIKKKLLRIHTNILKTFFSNEWTVQWISSATLKGFFGLAWFFVEIVDFFFFLPVFWTSVKLSVYKLHEKLCANDVDLVYCPYCNLLLCYREYLLKNAMPHIGKACNKNSEESCIIQQQTIIATLSHF